MEPEANSIEIMSYTYDGTNRVFVDLSNYHEWWINAPATEGFIVFPQEIGGVSFNVLPTSNVASIHSVGNVWVTGYAALWITLQSGSAGTFTVMGIRRR